MFDPTTQRFTEAGVFERDGLTPGDHIVGPAIIVERETATVVPTSFDALVLNDGCIRVTRGAAGGKP